MNNDQLKKKLDDLKNTREQILLKRKAEQEVIEKMRAAPKPKKDIVQKQVELRQTQMEPLELQPEPRNVSTASTQSEVFSQEVVHEEKIPLQLDEQSVTIFETSLEGNFDIPEVYTINSIKWTNKSDKSRYTIDCCWLQNEILAIHSTSLNNANRGLFSIYDSVTGSAISEFQTRGQPSAISLVPKSTDLFIIGGVTGLIYLYDKRIGEIPINQTKRYYSCHSSPILGLSFAQDKSFVSIGHDGSIYNWNVDTIGDGPQSKNHMSKYKTQSLRVSAFSICDNREMLIGLEDGSLLKKSNKSEELVYQFGSRVTSIDFRAPSRRAKSAIAACSLDGSIALNYGSGFEPYVSTMMESYLSCCWRPGSQSQYACCCTNNNVILFNDREEDTRITMDYLPTFGRFNQDGTAMCVGDIEGTVSLLTFMN